MRNVVSYTDVDLNSTGTTTIFAATNNEQTVYGVHLTNGGSTAIVQLEVTDGEDTVVLTPGQSAGDNVVYERPLPLDDDQSLQANVTTGEGSAQSNTAVALAGD